MSSNKNANFFNIKDLSQGIFRELTDGITTRVFPGDEAMVSIVTVAPNAKGKIHSHPQEQWGFLIEGSVQRIQDGKTFNAIKGDFWKTPGGISHGVVGGPEGALIFDVFAPPREEYLKVGSGFGTGS